PDRAPGGCERDRHRERLRRFHHLVRANDERRRRRFRTPPRLLGAASLYRRMSHSASAPRRDNSIGSILGGLAVTNSNLHKSNAMKQPWIAFIPYAIVSFLHLGLIFTDAQMLVDIAASGSSTSI